MNKSVIATIFALITTFVFSETMVINTNEFSVQVLNSNDQQTTISYDFGSYNRFPVEINGETYYRLHVENEAVTFDSAAPELPKITRSIIISDDAKVKVNVIEYEYTEYQFPIVPSKGLILRTQNPDEVPYTFGDIYQQDTEYPINIGELGTPYILRDFRGVSVTAYPFIYNPQTQTLRVYYHLILEVNTIGKDVVNVKTRITNSYDKYFEGLYSGHFINFDEMRYDTIDEHGRMIVIAYVAFMEAMQPFVDWKNQKGIPCDMYNVADIGSNSDAIKSFIEDEYLANNDLTFVQLVGDAAQVPPMNHGGNDSDVAYVFIDGDDVYPELFIGRFSAESSSHVETQVERTVWYERDIIDGEWLHKGIGMASLEGEGDDGESDDEHQDNIRDKLLEFTYTNINRINHYDPNTEVLFENLLNSGRGIINYTGHGSATAWLSGAYITNTVVNDLQNDFKLPFIHSVACLNGDFISTTCFAETWLRATNSSTGAPTGAIAMYASTINQSWAPPMRAQDHYIDLLVGFDYSELESIDQKNTIGGLWFNGSCNMVDLYGDDGMMATWTIFGDASLQVRTDTPTPISIVHDGIMYDDENTYYVSTGVEDALVSLSRDGEILASGYTDEFGEVTLQLDEPQIEPGLAILTVSAFNKITVVENVNVVRSIVLTNRRLSDDYNLGGTLTLDNVDTPGDDYPVIYSDDETPLEIEDDQQYIATTTQPLLGANDEYKHIQWNESPTDYLMEVEHIFQPDQTELKAYFETQSSATIEVNHPVELELHDPWYAYINIGEWIQPDEFLPLSELTTDGTYSVFLDQNPYFNEDNPIYSLRGPLSYNTIDETYEFSHWAGSGIIFENTYSNETKVVFLSEGATVEAHYSACYHNTSDWNIVGLPKIVEDSYYQTIFPNSISGTMYTFGAGYQQEANLDIGVGYYLRFYEAGVNCITGIPFTEITLGLSIGWNMISGISETVPVENILDPDNIIIPNTFYEYIDGGLYLTNQMIPGKGYWVRTYHEGEITITNTAQTAGEFVNLMENANWVKFTNDTGKEKKVYFGVDIPEEDQLSYTLPPLPPDEVMVQNFMDTRFTNGKTYTEDVGTIEVRNTDYPLTVEYGILNDNGEWEITSNAPKRINETEEYGDIGRVKLHRTGKIVVGHPIKSFTIRKTNTNNLPTEFALRQNYPNPFNPVTTIGYDIAESGNVRISVYALTGQRIKTLVSGYKEPGRYEVTWNSTDAHGNLMPTGVYFYAIETSTHTATKKLVLIK